MLTIANKASCLWCVEGSWLGVPTSKRIEINAKVLLRQHPTSKSFVFHQRVKKKAASLPLDIGPGHLSADDDAVAAGAALNVLLLVLGRGARVLVAAARTAAVETDALTLAGDAVALAGARGAV